MIGRLTWFPLLFYLLVVFLPATDGAAQVAREQTSLRVTAIDTSEFPAVHVRVLAAGPGSAPVDDLSALLLRENGVPIAETTLTRVPVGIDLVLIIDANNDFLQADAIGELTRREKVVESIGRFATGHMSAGRDRVTVIVPDEARQAPAFLTSDEMDPAALTAAVADYAPAPPADVPLRPTPLQAMLEAAVDHLAASQDDGRFQAVLLYSDAARLDRQLNAQPLVESAQAAGAPIFVAILGADASPEEQANAGRLADPTNGRVIHMPNEDGADALYAQIAAQGDQAEISYLSPVRRNGTQQIAVNLGNVRASGSFDLTLEPPEVAIAMPQTTIRRAGSAVDTPLPLLQPAVAPLTAQVTWPGGQTRRLTGVVFLVDGQAQPLAAQPSPDADGRLPLTWDISGRDAGIYSLSVEVTDELGFSAASEPVEVTIEVARPSPPTPTPAPTPLPVVAEPAPNLFSFLLPAALLAAAGGGLLWAARRARGKPVAAPAPAAPPPPPPPGDDHVPVLEWRSAANEVEQIELLAGNVTFGRDPEAVDIVLDDPSVSPLHARIRRHDDGVYWLYDEGSVLGTFLNYERLGLAPRPMRHGDAVQIGRVSLMFRLEIARLAATDNPQDEAGAATLEPPANEE